MRTNTSLEPSSWISYSDTDTLQCRWKILDFKLDRLLENILWK